MHRRRGIAVVVAVLAAAPAARAASFDSHAPAQAPPHWLPPVAWVYNHWLPFDEGRLYALLHIDRGDLWQQLRDDHRTLAGLARRHGWRRPARLAGALVAPWRGTVSPAQLAVLRSRALSLITQGHLAQHVFFHSLHQFAIASEAPRLFGVADIEFRALRRSELSPLAIGRLHGRSVGEIEAGAIAVLRGQVRVGISQHQMTAAQGGLLLRRQVSQLPRWLGQARYNGPPVTHLGQLVALPRDHAANPSISADGSRVVYEAYRQQLKAAITYGEIAVMQRAIGSRSGDLAAAPGPPSLTTAGAALVSRPVAPGADRSPRPASAYNPTVSGDGTRIAFERAPGNNNFAKRYGRIGIFLAGPSGPARRVDHPPRGAHFSQSAYNPQLSADGRRLVFEAVRDGGRVGIYESSVRGGRTVRVAGGMPDLGRRFGDVYEPSVDADGGRIAYTRVSGRVGGGRVASRVLVRDVASGRTLAASRRGELASNAALSPDGRWVAYVGARTLHLRDLRTGAETRVPTQGGAPLDPQLARGARVIAFTAISADGTARVLAYVRRTGRLTVIAPGDDPSISANGARIAFASRAADLDPGKTDDTEAVFVHDLAARRTTLVSAPSHTPAPPAAASPPRPERRVRGSAVTVSIFDNQFQQGSPTLHVRAGSVVGWDWRGRESHNVTVLRGPDRFHTRTRSGGLFGHRFTRPGVYRIVCSLHSPGMAMTLVVR